MSQQHGEGTDSWEQMPLLLRTWKRRRVIPSEMAHCEGSEC